MSKTTEPAIHLNLTPSTQEPSEQEEAFGEESETLCEESASCPSPEELIASVVGKPKSSRASSKSRMPVKREDMRPALHMDYDDPTAIPAHLRQEGYSYRWVRKSTDGMYDSRIGEMTRKGWEPVGADETHKFIDPLGRDPDATRFMCYKDVILMKRPTALSQKEDNALKARHKSIMSSLKHLAKEEEIEKVPYIPNWNF